MSRRGVTLIEVLVATVLLAIGIGGSLGALATALRFRTDAAARERLAATAHDRLSWFEAVGCTLPGDTTIATPPGAQGEESWSLVREPNAVRLEGFVDGGALGVPRLALETRQAC